MSSIHIVHWHPLESILYGSIFVKIQILFQFWTCFYFQNVWLPVVIILNHWCHCISTIQRKLNQHLANATKPRKLVQVKTGEALEAQVVLKQLQDEAKERAAKKKTKAKKVTNLLIMKEAKTKTEDLKNDENDSSDDANLENSNKTVFSSVIIVMERLHKKRKLVNMQYLWGTYLCQVCMPGRMYQSWTIKRLI